jgi:hypothetical protein
MQTNPHIAHLGKILRKMDSASPYLPPEFLALLVRLQQKEEVDPQRCPSCSGSPALDITREASPGHYLDVLRCRFCGQIVLELNEDRRRALEA